MIKGCNLLEGRDIDQRIGEDILGDGTALLKREVSVLEDRRLSQCRSTGFFEASRSETRILAIIDLKLVVQT